jgi:hypothetical protein
MTPREQATAVYRATRDAGAAGLAWEELEELTGLVRSQLVQAVWWLRIHGVGVVVARSRSDPMAASRVVLRKALPASWDALV